MVGGSPHKPVKLGCNFAMRIPRTFLALTEVWLERFVVQAGLYYQEVEQREAGLEDHLFLPRFITEELAILVKQDLLEVGSPLIQAKARRIRGHLKDIRFTKASDLVGFVEASIGFSLDDYVSVWGANADLKGLLENMIGISFDERIRSLTGKESGTERSSLLLDGYIRLRDHSLAVSDLRRRLLDGIGRNIPFITSAEDSDSYDPEVSADVMKGMFDVKLTPPSSHDDSRGEYV